MSIGGSSNLGTLLIRRLDTSLGVTLSQQSQIVNAARSDAIAQLADAARVSPAHNETGRPLAETIDKAQAQNERQIRQAVENTKLQAQQSLLRADRPAPETTSTPSAPTTLGSAAKAILALLSRFPDQAPSVTGRVPLIQTGTGNTPAPANPANASAPSLASQSAAQTTGAPGGPVTSTASTASAQAMASANLPPNALAALFTNSLSQAVQQSGLFYESHLRDLAFGARTAASLSLEPQAQAGRLNGSAPTHAGSAAPNTAATATSVSQPDTADTRGPGASTGSAQTGASQAAPSALAGMHPDTHLVVRQQLEVLASQVFDWRGEAWPDATMQWEVSRRNEENAPDEAGTHWATRLRLFLPSLGEVEARLSLNDNQVVMQLVAPQSAHTLVQHDTELRNNFREAGLTLSQLSILESERNKP